MVDWALPCVLAYGLDLCVGDPAWMPHPVEAIGALISGLETRLYRWRRRKAAGVVLLLITTLLTGAAAGLTLWAAARLGRWVQEAAAVLLLWAAFATRGLLDHGEAVRRHLIRGDLEQARRALARMVSRDTAELETAATARACIESLAENLVDGCIAPFCFALAGGPVAVWMYKSASTLDSMVGYRNERYGKFGWASARCDDVLNYLPARCMWALLPVASWCAGMSGRGCWRIMRRDGRKNPSPNSGWPEAGVAGALEVELGGPSRYGGVTVEKPRLNAGARAAAAGDIRRAQRLVLTASALAVLPAVVYLAAAIAHRGGRA